MRLFILIMLLPVTLYAQSAIQFSGITEEDKKWVLNEYKLTSENFSARTADKIVHALMKKSSYLNISVYKNAEGEVLITGEVQKKVRSIKFKGRNAIGEIDALNAIAIKPDTRLDQNKLRESAARLRELYGRSGYFNPVIKVNVPTDQTSEIDLLIEIDENLPCKIDGINIESENPALQSAIKSEVRSFKGDLFSEANIQELENEISNYLQEGRYLSARLIQKKADYNAKKTKATLTYVIEEPYKFVIEVNGNNNRNFSYSDIIRKAGIKNFDRTSLNPAAEIAEKIRQSYVSEGFAHVKIDFKFSASNDKFVKTVQINIEEGPKVRLSDIIVAGRLSRSPDYYSDFIQENSSEALDDNYYVKKDLDLGLKNLLTELNNQGYLRAKIQAARPEFNSDRSKVKLTVILDEGPLTQIKDISFQGNDSYTSAQLLKIIGLTPNSPLRLNQLETGLDQLKDFYRSQGHIEMGIENERSELVQYDEKGYEAKIFIKLYEGPKVYVREILVEGNNFTRDYVIQKEINIDPGELLTPLKIDEAQKRLDKLNIFSRVEIRTLEANTKVSKRTLIVSVTERNPGSFRVGVGVTNKRDFTVRGFTGISYSNLGGKARAISLRATAENNVARADYLEYEAALGYLEPFLFDTRFRARFNLSREEEVDNFTAGTSTVDATNKFSTLLERDMTSKIKFTWNFYTLERVERFFDPEPPTGENVTKQNIATIGPVIDVDYRDNPFLPTKGFFSRIEADYSAPQLGSSDKIQFVRTQATFSYYQPLWSKSFVWANSIRGGFAKNLINTEKSLADAPGVPRSYAFFLGGYTTIRGYSGTDEDRTPTNDELGITESDLLIISDETYYHLLKSEVRFPIYKILGGVVFFDAGAVDVYGINNRPQKLKRSYGLGLRINTPVGPISLDYGKKVRPAKGESPDQFHLSIGTF